MDPDRRTHPYRTDIASISLKGKVESERFVPARIHHVTASSVPLRRAPDPALGYDSELIAGEIFEVYDIDVSGFAWGQAQRDGYVGYLPVSALAEGELCPSHEVRALRSFLYPSAGIKTTPLGYMPYGARVKVLGEEGRYLRVKQGWLYGPHLVEIGNTACDPVAEAERFLGVPYLWGGKTSLGLDCSGLVQSVCFACGIPAPRDSDMQESELGTSLEMPADLSALPRGALLFWPGHVALSQGGGRMIHANAFHMMVESEPILPALVRIEASGSRLRSLRLLPRL